MAIQFIRWVIRCSGPRLGRGPRGPVGARPRPSAGHTRAFWSSLVDVAGRSDWQSPLYVAFAPLALALARSRRFVLALGGYSAYLFLTWWFLTHRLDRFWLPLLPFLAILAGLGADWSQAWPWRSSAGLVLTLALVCNLIDCTTALTGLNEWTASLPSSAAIFPAG